MELVAAYVFGRRLRRERRYRDPLDPLDISDEHILASYSFPRQEILALCQELEPHISRATKRSHAVPTHTQVLLALRFYASGTFQSVIGDSCGLTQASVSRIITRITNVLFEKARNEIKMPSSVVDINNTVLGFSRINGFPRVIGAIDGTHIPIKAPSENEHVYVNRKNFHSLNIQVVCNADNLITSYTAKYPGSTHDSLIWANCYLRTRFHAGEFRDTYLLGDSGYPCEPYLLTPFPNPSTPGEERYNNSHRRTRVIIEQTLGVLKSRFRCLHSSGGSLQYVPKKCAKIAVACMMLHNRCVKRRVPVGEMLDSDEDQAALVGMARHEEYFAGNAVRRGVVVNSFD